MGRSVEKAVTDKVIRAKVAEARRTGARVIISAGGVPGLQVRCYPDGTATYLVRYRKEEKQRSVTMKPARWPAIGVGEARKWARRQLAEATIGKDPWEARRERSRKCTMGALIGTFLQSKEAKNWRSRTKEEFTRLFSNHVLPSLGRRDANSVSRGEVRKLLDDLAERAPTTANRVFAVLRLLFNWARKERQEHLGITSHPMSGLEKPAVEQPRDRTYKDAELSAFLSKVDGELLDLVELAVFTGARDLNLRSMRWDDVDMRRAMWEIPATSSKSDRKVTIPLSTGALAVLRRRESTRFTDQVFPAANRFGHVDRPSSKVLRKLAKELGFKLRFHDIRRTVGDRVKAKFGEAIMHGLLGHTDGLLTRTYGPTPRLAALAEATEWWSVEVAQIRSAA